jgi:AraC family transcriptional regulator
LSELNWVAAQLLEAARCAGAGDVGTAQTLISRALLLLQGQPSLQSSAAEPQGMRRALQAWRARKVVAYVESNLSGCIRVEDLARVVGLSRSYFCHAFKGRFGSSVHLYITRRRIEIARQLMLTTAFSLSDIALSCGMSDQAHFTKVFRRIMGETPSRWRQSHQIESPRPLSLSEELHV